MATKTVPQPKYPQYDQSRHGNVFGWIVKQAEDMRPAYVEAAYNPHAARLRRL